MSNEMELHEIEGVQFFSSNDGSSGVSQRGLARLIGSHIANAKRDIHSILCKLEGINFDAETLQTVTVIDDSGASTQSKIYSADLCVAVIEYAAIYLNRKQAQDTYFKFAKIGFTKWVQAITAHKDRVDSTYETDDLELLQMYRQLIDDKIELELKLQQCPGIRDKLQGTSTTKMLGCADETLDEMCLTYGYPEMSKVEKRLVSRELATICRSDLKMTPSKKSVRYEAKSGSVQYSQLNAFPIEIVPAFREYMKTRKYA
jgi:hypothetical protein